MKLKYIEINGYGVLVDESADINIKDFCYDKDSNTIFQVIEQKLTGIVRSNTCTFVEDAVSKIIFAEKELNIDVPILPNWREWEVEQMIIKQIQELSKKHFFSLGTLISWGEGFRVGYNHKKSKYTIKDLRNAFRLGHDVEREDCSENFEKFINSLERKPKYIVMENERDYEKNREFYGSLHFNTNILQPKLITNSEGEQEGVIKEIIY